MLRRWWMWSLPNTNGHRWVMKTWLITTTGLHFWTKVGKNSKPKKDDLFVIEKETNEQRRIMSLVCRWSVSSQWTTAKKKKKRFHRFLSLRNVNAMLHLCHLSISSLFSLCLFHSIVFQSDNFRRIFFGKSIHLFESSRIIFNSRKYSAIYSNFTIEHLQTKDVAEFDKHIDSHSHFE